MATPSEKLAQSSETLAKLQTADGAVAIRARHISRTHRERLRAFSRRFYIPQNLVFRSDFLKPNLLPRNLSTVFRKDCSPLQHMRQFAHISRPRMLHQLLRRAFR
jgi:hypothetical protein